MYYFDSAYVAKCYINEPDSEPLREMVRAPAPRYTSVISIAEVSCAFRRQVRQHSLSHLQVLQLASLFRTDVQDGVWTLVPASERLLWEVHRSVQTLPPGVFLRAADAIHLASARSAGFSELWTSDRQMLRAASHFGLTGRSV